jgi:hypothetical protein
VTVRFCHDQIAEGESVSHSCAWLRGLSRLGEATISKSRRVQVAPAIFEGVVGYDTLGALQGQNTALAVGRDVDRAVAALRYSGERGERPL